MTENYDFTDYNYHIEAVRHHHAKKSDSIRKAIESLIVANYPKEKIAAKLKQDLTKIVSSSYISLICADMGCTDQRHNPVEIKKRLEALEQNKPIILNNDGTISIDERDEAPILEVRNSSKIDVPDGIPEPEEAICELCNGIVGDRYHEENKDYLHHFVQLEEFVKTVKHTLRDESFASKIPAKENEEFLYLANKGLEVIKDLWDKRQTVPVNLQAYLWILVTQKTNQQAAKNYWKYVRELDSFTSKQFGKTIRGTLRDRYFVYEPANKDDALLDGLLGLQCPTCGKFRVKAGDGLGEAYCYQCEKSWYFKRADHGYFPANSSEEYSEGVESA